jgi:radical SAM superfamily enzyme
MELEDYVSVVCDQLELLPQDTVIGRITGDGAPDALLAPAWSRKKFVVMNEIDKELVRRDSYQGKFVQNTQKT